MKVLQTHRVHSVKLWPYLKCVKYYHSSSSDSGHWPIIVRHRFDRCALTNKMFLLEQWCRHRATARCAVLVCICTSATTNRMVAQNLLAGNYSQALLHILGTRANLRLDAIVGWITRRFNESLAECVHNALSTIAFVGLDRWVGVSNN